METATAFRPTFGICCRPSPSIARFGVIESYGPKFMRFGLNSHLPSTGTKQYQPISHLKSRQGRKHVLVRASISSDALGLPSDSGGSSLQIAPLKLESPIGQFLFKMMISHPHLIIAAVEQQLEQLQADQDAEKQKDVSASTTDLVLYRRIAEVKAKDRKKTLEEILYTLVVQKFVEADVSLIPAVTLSSPDSSSRVESWQGQDKNLQGIHSPEAYEMIQNHLALILGNRLSDFTSVAQISKLRVGQVYAASVMYGYFLKRVDQRFQLEKTMKILPSGLDDVEEREDVDIQHMGPSVDGKDGVDVSMRSSRLRNYVMSFDGDTLQRYATIRSKESVNIIEKHTEALFGRPDLPITAEGSINLPKDKVMKISFGCLRRLVLEAVTFGSFLWDVESYVDSRYHFVTS